MQTNRAAWITEARSKRLVVQDALYPTPGREEIVVKTACVAINPVDYKIQEWDFMKMQYPAVLGCEVAGEIVAVGDQVRGFQIGQRVIGFVSSRSWPKNPPTNGDLIKRHAYDLLCDASGIAMPPSPETLETQRSKSTPHYCLP